MDLCLECGNEIVDQATACAQCGHPTRAGAPVLPFDVSPQEEDTTPDLGGAAACEATSVIEAALPAVAAPPPTSTRPALLLVAAAAIMGGLIVLALLRTPGIPVSNAAAAEPEPVPPAPVLAVEAPPAVTGRWSTLNRTQWLGRGNKGVVFDLAAENTVGVWMRNVRPVLVVRCVSGSTEAFVFTQSAARIEPGTDEHTVTLGFDDDEAITGRWPDSIEHDALFAPDGAALAKQLFGARSMRFGFTPHNAAPVVAHFHVEGLEELLRPSARECGLK
jgi:hypothetical protein